MDIAQEMLMTFNDVSDLLKKVVISDESGVYDYDIKTKPSNPKGSAPKSEERKKEVNLGQL